MAETVDTRGLYPALLRTPYGMVRCDKSGMGLLVFEQNSPGESREDDRLPLNSLIGDYDLLSARADFPYGTTALCPDMGQDGSRWWYPGVLPWEIAAPFDYLRLQGSVATPLDSLNGTAIGFNRFGAAFTTPAGFFSVGRRVRIDFDVLRTTNLGATTPRTQVFLGGIQIIADPTVVAFTNGVQWANNVVNHHCEIDFAVTTATQVTISSLVRYSTTTPPAAVAGSVADIAVASLAAAPAIEVGIYDSVAEAGIFKIINFRVRIEA